MYAVKFTEGSEDTIEGLAMPWGGPFGAGQDIQGEHFTKATDFAFSWFPEDGRPLLFHHGLDDDAGTVPVGRVKGYEVRTDIGVWTRAQLDKSSDYFSAIKDLVKAGKLFFSSGAMAHLVDVDHKSGEIKRWPWVELSLTPTPANLLARVEMAEASKHYKSAGLELPEEIKATLDSDARNNLSDGDFAYIDSEGGRHLPINDEAHCRNAIARFNQTQFESDAARATARRKILAKAKELGIEVSEEFAGGKSFVEFAATLLDGPGFDFEAVPISLQADVVTTLAASFVQRTKDLNERRIKEGRVLSASNRKLVAECRDMLAALLDASEPAPKQGTEGPAKSATPGRLRAELLALELQALALSA